ncbi:MAG TPA: aldo/keto reductase [Casimicrobiaceae bacterium]|nr:aldo/keto reductase [Casimicrobiaceae bacterium]
MSAPPPWPRLGLGCATLGTPPPGLGDADAASVMSAAIERGVRFFDVAPLYGGGLAEERLGRALARLPREQVVLCTKTGVTRPYAQSAMPPGATRRREFDRWDYSAGATRASVVRSLERLRTDRLDVVHIHDAEAHLDAALDAHAELLRMRAEGIVGTVGIGSNLVAPVAWLMEHAPFGAFLLAGRYTLLDPSGRALIERAHAHGVRVIAGGVFNSGILAAWPQPSTFDYGEAPPSVVARVARIADVCARHGVPLAAAALQFVLAHPAVTTVLIGPRTVAELDANLAGARVPIPDALWSDLEAAGLIDAGAPRPDAHALAHVLG